MKNLPLLLLIFTFILGCSEQSQTNQTKPTESSVPVAVKAEAFAKSYADNEVSADAEYKGKTVEVTGKVINIAEVLNTLQVDLEGVKRSGIDVLPVKCNVEQSEKESIAKLKKGQTVTMIGVNDGKTLNLYVGLSKCKVKS